MIIFTFIINFILIVYLIKIYGKNTKDQTSFRLCFN